jgi:hypothetical protein
MLASSQNTRIARSLKRGLQIGANLYAEPQPIFRRRRESNREKRQTSEVRPMCAHSENVSNTFIHRFALCAF